MALTVLPYKDHPLLISDLYAFQMVHYWTRVYWILKLCKLSFFNSIVKNIHKHQYFLNGFHPWEPAKCSLASVQALLLSSPWTRKKSAHWNALQQMAGGLQEAEAWLFLSLLSPHCPEASLRPISTDIYLHMYLLHTQHRMQVLK